MTEEHCPFHPDDPPLAYKPSRNDYLMCSQNDWRHYTLECDRHTYLYYDAKNLVIMWYYSWPKYKCCAIYAGEMLTSSWICNKPIRSLEHFIEYCKSGNYMTLVLMA